MVVSLAAVGASKAASKASPTTGLIIGIGALWLITKIAPELFNFGQNVFNKVNIGPETDQFVSGFLNQSRYSYSEDQTGSPNPPPESWWESPLDEGPMPVNRGSILSTPTPPVMDAEKRTTARKAGEATNSWFTNPWYYPWFYFAKEGLEAASNRTNADYFNEG